MPRRTCAALPVVLLVTWLSLTTACTSTANTPLGPMPVPTELNTAAVELAIVMAILDRYDLPASAAGRPITDEVFRSVVASYASGSERSKWFYEGRGPGVIYAGIRHRRYYAKCAIQHDGNGVTLSIIESRGLDQDEHTIHRAARGWLVKLQDRLRRTLGLVAQHQMAARVSALHTLLSFERRC